MKSPPFLCSASQIYGGDFAKFCGLLRIYELYLLDFYFSTGKMAACKPNYYSPPPEFQKSQHHYAKLNFLDRPEIVELPHVESCEELWRLGARKIVGVKPPALEIFGIKSTKSSIWLRYHSYTTKALL